MNITDETKWLYKEIWIWRGFITLLLILFTMIEVAKWIELHQHNIVNQVGQESILQRQERIMVLVNRNRESNEAINGRLFNLDNHIYECLGCHAHPKKVLDKWDHERAHK